MFIKNFQDEPLALQIENKLLKVLSSEIDPAEIRLIR